ncbi:polysaccharide deacetylase family protein [Chryseolinea lacunae]|uniref:Polysaccharide deacetylase family protein n=1 Tax=Chryseolinea lacunae TaxID=2801331 RepID=A0ABS1KRW8_9BACT|nr:polysaccharide deacetylase family protein [Chryseolinea lacunae]MBL0742218.1 polysaccharide deacetylase family protein [Chryseolinea lacunae]
MKRGLPEKFIVYGHLVGEPNHIVADYYRYPTVDEFDDFIRWVRRHGYAFVGLHDFLKEDGRKKILLTFDDGFRVVHSVLQPYMQANKLPYVLFVLTDPLDNPDFYISTIRPKRETERTFLTKAEILELKDQGVHIGFHTRSHYQVRNADIMNDIVKEQLTIPKQHEALFSRPLCFAYPYLAPDHYAAFDQFMKDSLGYQFLFDTKGFRQPDGNHFFRVSIDVEKDVTRKNWMRFVLKRQLLLYLKQKMSRAIKTVSL